jgi:hypothetical protein
LWTNGWSTSEPDFAEVLVRSLTSRTALGKTFELIAEQGPATEDFDAMFASLEVDAAGAL